MDPGPRIRNSSWKEFLDLGEELLILPDSAAICNYLKRKIDNSLNCFSSIWLAEPFYPLPGEKPIETLPSINASFYVKRAFDQKKIIRSRRDNHNEKPELIIALPILTQENLLGVIEVRRESDKFFTKSEVDYLEAMIAFAAVSMQMNRQVALKNWRYDQISLVRSVTSQIANVFDLDELSKRVTNLIQCSFDYYHVSLFTLDDGGRSLRFRASSLDCEPNIEHPLFSIKYGEGLIGSAAKSGKEFLVPDVAIDPLFKFTDYLPRTKSEAVLPLKVENRVIGILDLQSDRKGAFHENDMLVLRSLADSIALAIEGINLYRSLENRAEQITAVAEIGYALSSILDLDDLLTEVVSVIQKRFKIPFVHIYSVHTSRRKVIFQAGSGERAKGLRANSFAFELDSAKGIIPFVARSGESILANDVTKEPHYRPSRMNPQKTKSELTIPLKFGDDILGVLDLQSDQLNIFSQGDLELLESLSSGIALSIRNATLFSTERWRRNVADSFRDIAGMLSSNLALSELLDRILVALEKNLPCDASAIWLLDEVSVLPIEERPLRLAAVRGTSSQKIIESTEESSAVRKYLNYGITGRQVQIRKPEDPVGPLGAACNFSPNYSSLAVPLLSGDEVLGVLTIAHRAKGRYGSEASDIASTLASYAAVAIQNARLFTTAQEEAWSSTVLLQVAEAMQTITTVEGLFSTMARLTPLLVGIDQCAIFLKGYNKDSFDLRNWYGFEPSEEERSILDTDSISLLKMEATRAPVFITDPVKELGLKSLVHSEKTGTIVLLPLIAHDQIHGALLVSHNSKGEFGVQNRFSDQTLAILQGIAQQTSVAHENILLLESRQEEAYITAVLLQVAQAVVSQNLLDDILDTIVQLMPILVGVDTCVIYLWDKNNQRFHPSKAVAPLHTEVEEVLNHTYASGDFPFLDRLMETDTVIGCELNQSNQTVNDWRSLVCHNESPEHATENSNWLLGFPLSIKGEKYGVMLTREGNVHAAYHQKRIELLKGVAQQTALAIQNELLKEEMVGRERVEREFQLARQIQKTFLPENVPDVSGWDMDLRWRTAREVGGDFYDFFRTKSNKIALSIADVSDKGMPAALYMTVTRTLIRSTAQSMESPAEVLKRVNELLVMDSQNGMFVTAIFALLDPETGILEYANAGHNLPFLFKREAEKVRKLAKGGIALGVVEDASYVNRQITIQEGDTILFYTDGVTEAFSSTGELFSEKRLIEALLHTKYTSANQVLENVENLIDRFRKGEPPSDDLTMIAIHRTMKTPA